jgi:hypothetical protein
MVKKQKLPKKKRSQKELDSVFFLKLVMYFLFGSMWLHIATHSWTIPLPVGFVIGAGFVTHDHFQIDRKIELAVLLVSALLFYFLSPRLIIQL